jgi:DNA-binding response OmpR family regulator
MNAARCPAPVRSILIVEDDDDTLASLRDFFVLQGFIVYTAENGRRALDAMDRIEDGPGCILVDLDMPVMDGWQLLQALRSRPFSPPVIVLSGEDITRPPEARYYFSKPPLMDVLLRAAVSCSLRRPAPSE